MIVRLYKTQKITQFQIEMGRADLCACESDTEDYNHSRKKTPYKAKA